jgi:hypothetical protein
MEMAGHSTRVPDTVMSRGILEDSDLLFFATG